MRQINSPHWDAFIKAACDPVLLPWYRKKAAAELRQHLEDHYLDLLEQRDDSLSGAAGAQNVHGKASACDEPDTSGAQDGPDAAIPNAEPDEDLLRQTAEAMGDPAAIGRRLNAVSLQKKQLPLLLLWDLLILGGILLTSSVQEHMQETMRRTLEISYGLYLSVGILFYLFVGVMLVFRLRLLLSCETRKEAVLQGALILIPSLLVLFSLSFGFSEIGMDILYWLQRRRPVGFQYFFLTNAPFLPAASVIAGVELAAQHCLRRRLPRE